MCKLHIGYFFNNTANLRYIDVHSIDEAKVILSAFSDIQQHIPLPFNFALEIWNEKEGDWNILDIY